MRNCEHRALSVPYCSVQNILSLTLQGARKTACPVPVIQLVPHVRAATMKRRTQTVWTPVCVSIGFLLDSRRKEGIGHKQENPPEWIQEAFRPLRSKYSLCCPVLGVSHPWPGGTPEWGTPPGKGPGTSRCSTPWKGRGSSGSIMGWRWDTPCEQTDTCENSTFPSYYARGRQIVQSINFLRAQIYSLNVLTYQIKNSVGLFYYADKKTF